MKIVPWSAGYVTETLEESVCRPRVNIDPVIILPNRRKIRSAAAAA